MSGSGITVVTAADTAKVAAILTDGFRDDPVLSWVFADGGEDVMLPFFAFYAGEANIALGATFLSTDCCATWTPAGADPWSDEDLGSRFFTSMTTLLTAADLERLGRLGETASAVHPTESHWYLGMIATRPAAQRGGLGSAMLRHTLAIVDAADSPAYLESTNPVNVPLYERHGFVARDEIHIPDGPPLVPMWRPARAATRY